MLSFLEKFIFGLGVIRSFDVTSSVPVRCYGWKEKSNSMTRDAYKISKWSEKKCHQAPMQYCHWYPQANFDIIDLYPYIDIPLILYACRVQMLIWTGWYSGALTNASWQYRWDEAYCLALLRTIVIYVRLIFNWLCSQQT